MLAQGIHCFVYYRCRTLGAGGGTWLCAYQQRWRLMCTSPWWMSIQRHCRYVGTFSFPFIGALLTIVPFSTPFPPQMKQKRPSITSKQRLPTVDARASQQLRIGLIQAGSERAMSAGLLAHMTFLEADASRLIPDKLLSTGTRLHGNHIHTAGGRKASNSKKRRSYHEFMMAPYMTTIFCFRRGHGSGASLLRRAVRDCA